MTDPLFTYLAYIPTQHRERVWERLEDELEGSLHLDLNDPKDVEKFQALVSDIAALTVPTLSKALRAVLELHRSIPFYETVDSCGHGDDEHEIGNDPWGEELCLDSPTGDSACGYCTGIDSEIAYPCPTVRAITAALSVPNEGERE